MRRKTWLRAATAVFSKTSPPSPDAFNDTRAKLNTGGRGERERERERERKGTRCPICGLLHPFSTNTLLPPRRYFNHDIRREEEEEGEEGGGGEERESLSNEIFIGERIPLI